MTITGRLRISATKEQHAELIVLAGSRDREEVARAGSVLLTLSGWTTPRLAEAFCVHEDAVRLWQSAFVKGGVAAPKSTVAPGPAAVKSEAVLRVALPLLAESGADRPNGTIPRLCNQIEAREAVRISRSQLFKALRTKKLMVAPAGRAATVSPSASSALLQLQSGQA